MPSVTQEYQITTEQYWRKISNIIVRNVHFTDFVEKSVDRQIMHFSHNITFNVGCN